MRSITSAETLATATPRQRSRIAPASRSRSGGSRHLLSSTPGTRQRVSRISAAATTGPARAPRPTSSAPAMRAKPQCASCSSSPRSNRRR